MTKLILFWLLIINLSGIKSVFYLIYCPMYSMALLKDDIFNIILVKFWGNFCYFRFILITLMILEIIVGSAKTLFLNSFWIYDGNF